MSAYTAIDQRYFAERDRLDMRDLRIERAAEEVDPAQMQSILCALEDCDQESYELATALVQVRALCTQAPPEVLLSLCAAIDRVIVAALRAEGD